jgi:hypothetical protein
MSMSLGVSEKISGSGGGLMRNAVQRLVRSQLAYALALGTAAVLAGSAWADEPARHSAEPRVRVQQIGPVVTRRKVVEVEERVATPPLQIIVPCSDSWYPGLLRCAPPPLVVLPPFDAAVVNALHGAPPAARRPFPRLFSW